MVAILEEGNNKNDFSLGKNGCHENTLFSSEKVWQTVNHQLCLLLVLFEVHHGILLSTYRGFHITFDERILKFVRNFQSWRRT